MVEFSKVKIPAGDLIEYTDGKLIIGDHPIIGCLRGDGIGLDITPVMKDVVDSAVERAYGGRRKIAWCDLYAGLEGLNHYGSEFPDETVEAIRHLKIAIKGPFTTPIGEETHVCLHCAHQQYHEGCLRQVREDRWRLRALPFDQRALPPVPRSLRLRAPRALLRRRTQPEQVRRSGELRDLPREHRGCVRGP